MPNTSKPWAAPFRAVAAWRRRVVSRLVHRGARWVREAGSVTRERPGPYRFRAFGEGSRLAYPQGTVFGEPWITVGAHCVIGQGVTLTAGMMPDLDLGPDPLLSLGDGVVLGRGTHVIADTRLTIGDDTFVGPHVYLTTTNHSYDDPQVPVGRQWPRSAPVEIGAGSWIGTGAVILPGARLGRNSVVAAGSVVRGEVPDHAVVAGAPARVVRRWEDGRGWQPPLRTPAPTPVPEGVTPQELLDIAAADELPAEPAAVPAPSTGGEQHGSRPGQ
ncbi:acyltransferase [Streptomyces sp. NPDC059740]|uniref:acyltransferase n=1 Tax=Streptomyces sp. NPDC059740 TaxID=3346926 RepID=UPI003647B95E